MATSTIQMDESNILWTTTAVEIGNAYQGSKPDGYKVYRKSFSDLIMTAYESTNYTSYVINTGISADLIYNVKGEIICHDTDSSKNIRIGIGSTEINRSDGSIEYSTQVYRDSNFNIILRLNIKNTVRTNGYVSTYATIDYIA